MLLVHIRGLHRYSEAAKAVAGAARTGVMVATRDEGRVVAPPPGGCQIAGCHQFVFWSSLPGVRLLTRGVYWVSSVACVLVVTPACQIGYMEATLAVIS